MLNQLFSYNHVAVQYHDNPDACAIASAYGLYRFFIQQSKKAVIDYGGKSRLGKPNFVRMLDPLQISLEYGTEETG